MEGATLRRQQALVLRATAEHGDGGANAHEVQLWLRAHAEFVPERNAIGSRFAELAERGFVGSGSGCVRVPLAARSTCSPRPPQDGKR